MKNDPMLFETAGLSENEGRVYVAALHGGRMTLSQLSRATSLGKTTLYPYIESLSRQGLLEKTIVKQSAKNAHNHRPSSQASDAGASRYVSHV